MRINADLLRRATAPKGLPASALTDADGVLTPAGDAHARALSAAVTGIYGDAPVRARDITDRRLTTFIAGLGGIQGVVDDILADPETRRAFYPPTPGAA